MTSELETHGYPQEMRLVSIYKNGVVTLEEEPTVFKCIKVQYCIHGLPEEYEFPDRATLDALKPECDWFADSDGTVGVSVYPECCHPDDDDNDEDDGWEDEYE